MCGDWGIGSVLMGVYLLGRKIQSGHANATFIIWTSYIASGGMVPIMLAHRGSQSFSYRIVEVRLFREREYDWTRYMYAVYLQCGCLRRRSWIVIAVGESTVYQILDGLSHALLMSYAFRFYSWIGKIVTITVEQG